MNAAGVPRAMLRALRSAALRVQVPAVLSLVPLVAALHGAAAVDLLVADAMGDAAPDLVERARTGARRVVAAVVVVAAVSSAAAALLLRGTIRSVVERLHAATEAIARGDLGRRVADGRRDELGELGRAIDVLGDRLRRLEQSRRRTLACVSHELRTPLTIVQGHAFTLARDEGDPRRLRRLELIQAEAGRLAALVDDLVDAASLHAGGARLVSEQVDLAQLASAAAERFSHAAAAAGVRLQVVADSGAGWVDADPRRLDQLLGNLLGNAVRHAPRGSTIELEVSQLADRRRRIRVCNLSEPLQSAVLDRMFEPFVQGEARTGSVGLGLAIARAITEAHGGTVAIDEAAARTGTVRITVELPAPSRAAAMAIDAPRAAARRPRTALVGLDA